MLKHEHDGMDRTTNNTKVREYKEKNPNEVGACWTRKNSKNMDYLSIKININGEDIFLKGFKNSSYSGNPNDKQPQYLLFMSTFDKNKKQDYSQEDIDRFNKS